MIVNYIKITSSTSTEIVYRSVVTVVRKTRCDNSLYSSLFCFAF